MRYKLKLFGALSCLVLSGSLLQLSASAEISETKVFTYPVSSSAKVTNTTSTSLSKSSEAKDKDVSGIISAFDANPYVQAEHSTNYFSTKKDGYYAVVVKGSDGQWQGVELLNPDMEFASVGHLSYSPGCAVFEDALLFEKFKKGDTLVGISTGLFEHDKIWVVYSEDGSDVDYTLEIRKEEVEVPEDVEHYITASSKIVSTGKDFVEYEFSIDCENETLLSAVFESGNPDITLHDAMDVYGQTSAKFKKKFYINSKFVLVISGLYTSKEYEFTVKDIESGGEYIDYSGKFEDTTPPEVTITLEDAHNLSKYDSFLVTVETNEPCNINCLGRIGYETQHLEAVAYTNGEYEAIAEDAAGNRTVKTFKVDAFRSAEEEQKGFVTLGGDNYSVPVVDPAQAQELIDKANAQDGGVLPQTGLVDKTPLWSRILAFASILSTGAGVVILKYKGGRFNV